MYMLNIYACQAPERFAARSRSVGEARFPLRGLGIWALCLPQDLAAKCRRRNTQEVRPFHHDERRAVPTPCTCIKWLTPSPIAGSDAFCGPFARPIRVYAVTELIVAFPLHIRLNTLPSAPVV